MTLSHEDLQAIEKTLGSQQVAPIIHALEKMDREQKIEVKRDLLIELATKADIANLRAELKTDMIRLEGRLEGRVGSLEVELKGEIKRLEQLIKILIGLAVMGMALFSPPAAELIRLLK